MSLGEKITSLRKSKGISQELLAENSRVSLRTIQRIESGISTPRLYTIKVIATALDVEVDYLNLDEQSDQTLTQHRADLESIRLINLSALAVVIVPFSNIILPVLIWNRNRNYPLVDEIGRKIISFQILWMVITILVLVATRLLQVSLTGSVAIGHFPLFSVLYFLLVFTNLLFIIRSAFQLQTEVSRLFFFIPRLF